MRNLILLLFFTLIQLNGVEAASSLYTKDEFVPLEVNQISHVLKRFHENDPHKNILFYVHGRKKDIEKEWKNLATLEKTFNVKIVMFHWPAWSSTISRPVGAAEDASIEFGDALKEISDYKRQNTEEFIAKRISLLTHSMGNIVVSHYTLNYYASDKLQDDDQSPLFDNFIASAPDVPMLGHKEWLSMVTFAKNRFVMMNNGDAVLRASYLLDIVKGDILSYKLGLGFETFSVRSFFIEKIIDKGSTYIDLSKVLKAEHRHFQANGPWVDKIFHPLFNGIPVDITKAGLDYQLKKGIYYVKD
jgi:esterase/lipase superfamily enzyme